VPVWADTAVRIALGTIGEVEFLRRALGRVSITRQVAEEVFTVRASVPCARSGSRNAMIASSLFTVVSRRAGQGRHRGTGIRDPRKLRKLVADLRRAAIERTELAAMIAEVFDDIERDPQPFVDCNHRTAMLLGRFLAHEFRFSLRYSGPEGERLRRDWENLPRRELETWVREHLVPLEGD